MNTDTTKTPGTTPPDWNLERPFGEPGVYICGPNSGLIAKLYEPDANYWNKDKVATIDGNGRLLVASANSYMKHFKNPVEASEGDLLGEALAALKNAGNVMAGLATSDLLKITKDSPALKQIREVLSKAGRETK